MMCYYDEDFYDCPSEFEEKIDEFKQSLMSSVKEDFLAEMDALRKENESLREFRDKKDEYENKLKAIQHEYNIKMRNAQIEVNKKRANEILREILTTGYRPDPEYKQRPKCDKCDDNRQIHFTSPSGRKMRETCSCAVKTVNYSPEETMLLSFCISKENSDMYFELVDKNEYYDRYDYIANIYDREKPPFEEVNCYTVVFLNKKDCQKYCDWLNDKEAQR